MDSAKSFSTKAEEYLDHYASPLKPYLPALARFLLVVTFYEDALRIFFQWDDQVRYIKDYRRFPWGVAHVFLLFNIVVQLIAPTLTIMRRYTEYSVLALFVVVIGQAIGYGLVFDPSFFLRNLSVIGGLLILLAEAVLQKKKKNAALAYFQGLSSSLKSSDATTYLQLFGRILLVFLFFSLMLAGEMTVVRGIVSVIGLAACGMVVVGFKAKWSAIFLVAFLSISNVLVNNWWSLHHDHPNRDFLKYDFFQTLSIMGGFMLLASMGPGGISIDEKKKDF